MPEVGEGCLVEMVKSVYGLIDAPPRWWQSFTAVLRGLDMHQSVLDPCVFYCMVTTM